MKRFNPIVKQSVKQFETIAVAAVAFVLFSALSSAQVSDYYLNVTLSESGKSLIEMELFPTARAETFRLSFRGDIQNFNTNAACSLQTGVFSFIECKVGDVNKVTISFETEDFVTKVSQNRIYFSSSFGINQNVTNLFASISLPDGMILVDKSQTQFEYVVYPENPNIVSDGRKLVLSWQMQNVKTTDQLRFEVLYEQIIAPPWFQLQLRHFALAGVAFAVVFGFIYLRYFAKKSEKLVLSVLDEYERKVVDILLASNSPLNQRKIVQETNFSKAKVSRVVKSLAGRGLVEVERRGRTNILKLLRKRLQV